MTYRDDHEAAIARADVNPILLGFVMLTLIPLGIGVALWWMVLRSGLRPLSALPSHLLTSGSRAVRWAITLRQLAQATDAKSIASRR